MSWPEDLGKLTHPQDRGINLDYPDLRIEVNLEELVATIKKLGGATIMVFEAKEQMLQFNPLALDSLIRIIRPSMVTAELVVVSQIHGASKKDAEHIALLLGLEEQHTSIFRNVWANPMR